ncbi:hypothetical protein ACHAWX_004045 [Stephanocyclus meneghinianus]
MVYYFTTRCGNYVIYMGKDKYENEDLIKYGHPEDCWFHVDDLSSAHVYLRLKPGMTLDDIPEDCLLDCCSVNLYLQSQYHIPIRSRLIKISLRSVGKGKQHCGLQEIIRLRGVHSMEESEKGWSHDYVVILACP